MKAYTPKQIAIFIIVCVFIKCIATLVYGGDLTPYYNSWEDDGTHNGWYTLGRELKVDNSTLPDNCNGIDFTYPSKSRCGARVENTYPPRYGEHYAHYYCNYPDNASLPLDANEASRVDSNFEVFDNPAGCNDILFNDGTEYWWGFSFYIPVNYYQEYYNTNVVQIKADSGGNLSINMNITYGGGADGKTTGTLGGMHGPDGTTQSRIWWDVGDWTNYRGKWLDVVLHTRYYTTDNANAIFQLWFNGDIKINRTGVQNISAVPADLEDVIFANNAYSPHYLWDCVDETTCKEHIKQWDVAHTRESNFDEMRLTQQVGGSGDFTYCDVVPPTFSEKPNILSATATQITYSAYTEPTGAGIYPADTANCFTYGVTNIDIDNEGGDFSTPIRTYTGNAPTSWTYTALSNGNYKARVRHQSSNASNNGFALDPWSYYSDTFNFTVGSGGTGKKIMGKEPTLVMGKAPAKVMGKDFQQTPESVLNCTDAASPSSINLTVEGALDWHQWGSANTKWDENRKNTTQQISDFSFLPGSDDSDFGTFRHTAVRLSWSDGTPVESATSHDRLISFFGVNKGYTWTVPATTTQKRVKSYISVKESKGRVTVSLPGATDYTLDLENTTGITDRVIDCTFRTGTGTDTLTFKNELITEHSSWPDSRIFQNGVTLQ